MLQGGALSMADLMRRLADKATVKLQGLERLLCAHLNALAWHHLEACQGLMDNDTSLPELPEPAGPEASAASRHAASQLSSAPQHGPAAAVESAARELQQAARTGMPDVRAAIDAAMAEAEAGDDAAFAESAAAMSVGSVVPQASVLMPFHGQALIVLGKLAEVDATLRALTACMALVQYFRG